MRYSLVKLRPSMWLLWHIKKSFRTSNLAKTKAASRETCPFGIYYQLKLKQSSSIQMKCMLKYSRRSVLVSGYNIRTWNMKPLDPSLKLAATLRHLDYGAKYSDMQYSWWVAKKTLYIVVMEVCNAMCEEYVDEVMTAPSHLKNGNNWQMVSSRSGTFLTALLPLMANT